MKKRVKITQLPKAQSGLDVKLQGLKAGLGFNANTMPWPVMAGKMSKPGISVNTTLQPVPREQANLEAEKGEVATVPGKGGIPSTFKIAGNRHANGGTPLNLPADSFIYSDTKGMRIKDPNILKQFGMVGSGPYTPADIAKKYDVNKFKKILADPDTDDLQRKTAEGMIANFNMKLAKLALLQESMKGFPQGIPSVAIPYMEEMQIDPSEFVKMNPQDGQEENTADDGQEQKYGGIIQQLRERKSNHENYFQAGGQSVITQPKRSDRVIFNPQTNQYEVYNWSGKMVGILNVPKSSAVTQPVATPTAATSTATTTATPASTTPVTKTKALTTDDHLKLISDNFSDPRVQQALYDRTLAAAQKPENQGKSMGFTIDELKAMAPADLANQFIEMQKRNLKATEILTKAGADPSNLYGCFDNNTGLLKSDAACKDLPYKSLDDVFTATGVGSPADARSKGLQQAAYIGYRDLLDDNKAGKLDKGVSDLLTPFRIKQFGVQDESGVDPDKDISRIDTYYTNTTAGQVAGLKDEAVPEATPAAETVVPETSQEPAVSHLQDPQVQQGSPWWLQDIVKTAAAAGDLSRIKKYMPWEATPNVVTPDVTFYDPTRELAANSELVNQGANALGQIYRPQEFSSRFSQLQGTGLKSAADTLATNNNLNVGISNQQQVDNATTMNNANLLRSQQATSLWDKYQTVNQNFDAAKAASRDNLVNQYVNAVTNKNYTANLNKMYPQFAVNPAIGGEYYFHDPRALSPDYTEQPTADDYYEQMLTEHPTWKGTDEGLKMAWDAAKLRAGVAATPFDAWTQYQQSQGVIPQYPGQVATQ